MPARVGGLTTSCSSSGFRSGWLRSSGPFRIGHEVGERFAAKRADRRGADPRLGGAGGSQECQRVVGPGHRADGGAETTPARAAEAACAEAPGATGVPKAYCGTVTHLVGQPKRRGALTILITQRRADHLAQPTRNPKKIETGSLTTFGAKRDDDRESFQEDSSLALDAPLAALRRRPDVRARSRH